MIRKSNSKMILSKKKYITKLPHKSKMNDANPQPIPTISNLQLSKNKGEPIFNIKQYKSIVGALQYATMTGPHISFNVKKCLNLCRIH